jgi:hypothetical protein
MNDTRFDTELFIDEVEKRTALWDVQCPAYKDRQIRKTFWEELVEICGEAGETTEKNKIFVKF